jgi:hypothetical protein
MPRCSCAGNSCSCLIQVGDGLVLTGTGNNSAPYTLSLASPYVPIAHGTSGGLDLSAATSGSLIHVTLSANVTGVTLSTIDGQWFDLFLQQGTAGNTIVWPADIRWAGGTDPVLSTTVGWGDWFRLRRLTGTSWIGSIEGVAVR